MSIAHSAPTHNHDVSNDALDQIRRAYPELNAQDAFLVPTWYYRQTDWIEDSVGSENALYNLPIVVRITGALDLAILRECLFEVQRRQEVLRSVFRILDGRMFQVIVPPPELVLEVVDLRKLPPAERDANLASGMSEEAGRPFELATNLPLRTRLFRLGDAEHVLQLTTHHLVCDDWSSGILVSELLALYDNLAAGTSEWPPERSFHYGDFIRWRQRHAEDDARRQGVWKSKLSGSKGFYHVPPDLPRPFRRTRRGARVNFTLPKQLETALKQLGQRQTVTFFMTLLSGFQLLLHLLSGDADIAVGTCAANRPLPAVEKLIGRFANDLVVRTDYSGDPSLRELLSRTRDAALEGYDYQDLPFGAVLEELVPVLDPGSTPLFQCMFILQNAPKASSHSGAIAAETVVYDTQTAKYDLAVWVRLEKDIEITFEYNRDLFREETIKHMADDYKAVLAALAADPEKRVSDVRSSLAMMQPDHGKANHLQDCTPGILRNEIDTELMNLWRDVLGVYEIRVTDDFFELGGDSLRATQLLQRIKQRLGANLLLGSLSTCRTIQQQALAIAQQHRSDENNVRRSEATNHHKELRCANESCEPTGNDIKSSRGTRSNHKSLFRRASNRLLHLLCRFLPGATTVRPFLHRLRGVRIGKDVWIGDDVYLENEFPEHVEIHDGATINLRSTIIAHTNGAGKVIIGRHAYIGAGSTVVTSGNRSLVIGEGAVLMASSLVTGSLPPYTLYGRDPAKPLAKVTKPFTASTTYEEFMTTLRPLSG
jgi:acetyltransferase-like isoleucine patch superfamily enzyme/acyl carrier protein